MVAEVDPGPDAGYFWAHQFVLIGGTGGYLGLQTRSNVDGTWGKIAIFSIWDALAAEGRTTVRFGGEGEGWSCRILYPWEAGRAYHLRLHSPERGWWTASVGDAVTGRRSQIGSIQVPTGWERLDGWSVMWTEWYGAPPARCADLPHSSVVFHTPTADGGRVVPDQAENRLSTGADCENSLVERLPHGSRQQVGVPQP